MDAVTTVILILLLIVNVIGSWVLVPLLKSYSAEKGKNLATREDIDGVVAQVSRVTRETEEIKAAITTDLWARQKRWEIVRDLYIRLIENLGVLEIQLIKLEGITRTVVHGDPGYNAAVGKEWEKHDEILMEAKKAASALRIVAGNESRTNIEGFLRQYNSRQVRAGQMVNSVIRSLIACAQKDLGLVANCADEVSQQDAQPGTDKPSD